MVQPAEFEQARADICASGPPSSGDNLLGMEIDACAYLGDPAYSGDEPDLWTDMTVRRPGSDEWLIAGTASGRTVDAPAIAAELSRVWEQHLRYNYRSAHTVISAPDSVTLQAVTQAGPREFWVTACIRVNLTPPPLPLTVR